MKEWTKFGIYGLLLFVATLVSTYPLVLIQDISNIAYGYAVISWALMLFIGYTLSCWGRKMDRINKLRK